MFDDYGYQGDPPEKTRDCLLCKGKALLMGALGRLYYYRCLYCGMDTRVPF